MNIPSHVTPLRWWPCLVFINFNSDLVHVQLRKASVTVSSGTSVFISIVVVSNWYIWSQLDLLSIKVKAFDAESKFLVKSTSLSRDSNKFIQRNVHLLNFIQGAIDYFVIDMLFRRAAVVGTRMRHFLMIVTMITYPFTAGDDWEER